MVKDYVMDLTTPHEDDRASAPVRVQHSNDPLAPGERSIRNVTVQRRTPPSHRMGGDDIRSERAERPGPHYDAPVRRKGSRMLWIIAIVAMLILGGIAALFFLGSTSIDVTPRVHRVTFDETTSFTAYPAAETPEGAISYAVETRTIEDSASVPAQGTERGEERASGNITVINEYSENPVRLIKNTRFETPDGLVFRIPASVDVPGKTDTGPGEVTVTVVADGTGESYNVGPISRFSLPGLEGTPEMFTNVYARSTEAFTGGFVGERPVVTTQALEAARAEIRNRLTEQAQNLVSEGIDGAFVFPTLVDIAFESLPTTSESSGNARIRERAVISMLVMPDETFASAIARAVRADAEENSISLQPGTAFSAEPVGELPEQFGQDPVTFSLAGAATLVWNVDAELLKQSLAGRQQEAFEGIVSGFPGIEKAEAHIAPFWASAFPEDPAAITVNITPPTI